MYHCMYVLQTFIYYKSLNENYFHFFILFFFLSLCTKTHSLLYAFIRLLNGAALAKINKQTKFNP